MRLSWVYPIGWLPALGGASGCLVPQSALRLAGVENPAFTMKTPNGWKVDVPTDANGKVKYMIRPDGSMEFEMTLRSRASEVIDAQGERAEHLQGLREIEAARIVQMGALIDKLTERILAAATPIIASSVAPKPEPEPAAVSLPPELLRPP